MYFIYFNKFYLINLMQLVNRLHIFCGWCMYTYSCTATPNGFYLALWRYIDVLIMTTHPLSVLVGTDQQLYNAWDCSVLSQRGVIRWTQRQVADQSNDGFDKRPPAGRVEQLHKHGQSVVKAHSILGHLCLWVATREMAQGTNLSDSNNNNNNRYNNVSFFNCNTKFKYK